MSNRDDLKALSRQRYGRYALDYVTSEDHAQGPDLGRLVELAQPRGNWLVLDVASGGGIQRSSLRHGHNTGDARGGKRLRHRARSSKCGLQNRRAQMSR